MLLIVRAREDRRGPRYQHGPRHCQVKEYRTLDVACKSNTWGSARVPIEDRKYKPGRLADAGFYRTVRDYAEAKHRARFPTLAMCVLYEAEKLSWDASTRSRLNESLPFRLNATQIGLRYDADRKTVERRIADLTLMRVLVPVGDGTFHINKDYLEWLNLADQEPLFDRETVADILKEVGLLGFSESGTSAPHVGRRRPMPEASAPHAGSFGAPKVGRRRPMPEASAPQSGHPPRRTPCRTHASEEFQKSKKSFNTELPTQSAAVVEDGPVTPPYPDENGALDIHTGKHPVNEQEARSIWGLLWRSWGDQRLCNQFYEHQCWFTSELWRAAIREAVRTASKPNTIRFLEVIAGRFELNGIPVESPPTPGAPPKPRVMTRGQAQIAELKRRIAAKAAGEATDGP